jgi:16S rRNA (cytidine1402-2'-O)-methyltransferase
VTTDGAGVLTIVATPLGNRDDLSPRAARALREADLIVAEDTRSARRLLAEIGAGGASAPPVLSCFDANEDVRATEVADQLRAGARVVLISEAGTPLVSDPGYRVVSAAVASGARVVPVPGPSAVLAALVAAGLPTDRFLFLGFPPRRSGARRRLFETVRLLPFTLVLYESPMRAGATLADLAAVLGPGRRAALARELTKVHEEIVRDDLGALAARYGAARPLGEVTLVVAGAPDEAAHEAWDDEALAREASALLAEGLSPRDAARELAATSGRPRREVYRIVTGKGRGEKSEDEDEDGE